MPNIKLSAYEKYNSIIRDNRRATKKLEENGEFPIVRFDVNISELSKQDYANLVDWSGEKNAMYFSKCISAFYKNWIFLNAGSEGIVSVNSIMNTGKKKDQLILDISDCLEVQKLNIKPISFFKELEQKPYHKDLEVLSKQGAYGYLRLPISSIGLDSDSKLELSLAGNCISRTI